MSDLTNSSQNLMVVALILIISIQYTALSSIVDLILVTTLYILLITFFILKGNDFQAKKVYIILFLAIVVVSIISSLLNSNIQTSIRVLALITFTGANLFIIPQLIPFSNFKYTIPRICVFLLLIGLLPLIHAPSTILFFDLEFHSETSLLPFLPTITSIYANPNTLGFVMFVGSVLSFSDWVNKKDIQSLVLFTTLFIGSVLTNNRSGMIAFIVAAGLFVIYHLGRDSDVLIALLGGLTGTLILLLALFGLIPGTSWLTDISLNNRRGLWTAGIDVFLNNPIFGQGLAYGGTHNSFIRMFAALGFFGGLLYMMMYFLTLIQSAKHIITPPEATVSVLLAGYVYVQLFEGVGFIGISIHSTVIAITMGYYITSKTDCKMS